MRQFYLDIQPPRRLQPGDTATLDAEESHHLLTVLRGGRDGVLNLVDGFGVRYTARADGQEGRLATVEILTAAEDDLERTLPRLLLGISVVKGKRFEWALEKSVELGAHVVVPILAERGVVTPGQGKQRRWLTILVSALKQSRRSYLPELKPPLGPVAAAGLGQGGPVFFGSTSGGEASPAGGRRDWTAELVAEPEGCPTDLTLLIGPEGGWTEVEERDLAARGAVPVGLGPHVLRTETAAAAGLFFLQGMRQRIQSSQNRG